MSLTTPALAVVAEVFPTRIHVCASARDVPLLNSADARLKFGDGEPVASPAALAGDKAFIHR